MDRAAIAAVWTASGVNAGGDKCGHVVREVGVPHEFRAGFQAVEVHAVEKHATPLAADVAIVSVLHDDDE